MTTYFRPGDGVIHHSHDGEEVERGTVVYDDPTGWVFVDYGQGRVMTSRRQNLTKDQGPVTTDHAAQKLAEMRDLRGISTTEHEEHQP